MATGTLSYNALRTKTVKERIKTQRKIVSHSLDKSNAVSIGSTAVKQSLSICRVSLVWFARYCGKMYSRYLFSYGGLDGRTLDIVHSLKSSRVQLAREDLTHSQREI